ncbi:efflux RND transporter periplasmic adaptor subunit [Olivibacter sp. XZL3]|uniref:efflux RND transporter periplasmic adaptor subunit n=1 Tax=Olivibacter sp. XZL3 TaxID=1735116 RepID=UPI0010662F1E|nr:efflux RND transporter periplasmic adaptor subunit [Olivibacter sp. XZL3]
MRKNFLTNCCRLSVALLALGCSSQGESDNPIKLSRHLTDSSIRALTQATNQATIDRVVTIEAEAGPKVFPVHITGRVSYDTKNNITVSSRVNGRLERIHIKYNFQPVQKGQLLFEIYSPELVAAQRELLLLQSAGEQNLLSSARKKLHYLGMTDAQIQGLLQNKQVAYRVPIYSPASGYIVEKNRTMPGSTITTSTASNEDPMGSMGSSPAPNTSSNAVTQSTTSPLLIRQGEYVGTGQAVFTIYKNSELLAEFAVPPAWTAKIVKGKKILFQSLEAPMQWYQGTVDLIQPTFNTGENFALARIYLKDTKLPVGQLLKGIFAVTENTGYWLPKTAVISLGTKNIVFKQERNTLRPMVVKVGVRTENEVQILSDIASWQIAKNGAYLVDSEDFIVAKKTEAMNRKRFIQTVLLSAAMPSFLWTSCSGRPSGKAGAVDITFTCPMHPQIVENHGDTCPICGMDLVPFDKSNKDKFLTLSANQQTLANIATAVIGVGSLSEYTAINGKFTVNPEQTSYISSRTAGRIEDLYVKETGISVKQGQALYRLYAEALLALQEEFLMTYKQALQFADDQRFADIFKAAKQKLLLYGQTESQLAILQKRGKVDPYITFYAPSSGTIAELLIGEGQYINEGTPVLRLESYDTMWVEADIYPRETVYIKEGQELRVIANGDSNNQWIMRVQFITPNYQNNTQIAQLRGTVINRGSKLQAGMPATIFLPKTTQNEALTVPSKAIIREGSQSHVWIASGQERFEPRLVKTGIESFGETEITAGLSPGEKIVISGAYLLYSEYVLKKGALFN